MANWRRNKKKDKGGSDSSKSTKSDGKPSKPPETLKGDPPHQVSTSVEESKDVQGDSQLSPSSTISSGTLVENQGTPKARNIDPRSPAQRSPPSEACTQSTTWVEVVGKKKKTPPANITVDDSNVGRPKDDTGDDVPKTVGVQAEDSKPSATSGKADDSLQQSMRLIFQQLESIDDDGALKILSEINKRYAGPLKTEQSSNDTLSNQDPGHCSGHGDASITKTLFDDLLSDIQHINSGESDLNTTDLDEIEVSTAEMMSTRMITKNDLMIMNVFDGAVTYCMHMEQIALLGEYKFWESIKDDLTVRPNFDTMVRLFFFVRKDLKQEIEDYTGIMFQDLSN
jgi:hypothetical protein